MIKLEHTEVYGWQAAIRGMRNAMNSWEKSDSVFDIYSIHIGANDHDLMMRLAKAGSDHRKYMRMIVVYLDITAPIYWWKEFDTYKVGTVANSTSTMHRIHAKELTVSDFSHEHLIQNEDLTCYSSEWLSPSEILKIIVTTLNGCRKAFVDSKDKKYWWQMIQLLPSSFNQKRTVMLNYEVLRNMYHSRKNHKLDEWHTFCDWIECLPYSEIITGDIGHGEEE